MADIVFLGFSLPLTLVLVITVVVLFFVHDYWCRTYFARHGIPSAPSLPIFGHALEYPKGTYKFLQQGQERYGKVFGMYDFRQPVVVISDPDLCRKILVKDFSHFYNRYKLPLQAKMLDHSLVWLTDERWRDVRNVMTPAFSAAKMKSMSPLINDCADILVEHLGKNQRKDGSINFPKLYGSFLMDTIATCAFSLNVDSQQNPNDPFVKHAKKAFKLGLFGSAYIVASIFPPLAPILEYLKIGSPFPKESVDFFSKITTRAAEFRKTPDGKIEKRTDFLQLITNTQDDTEDSMDLRDENGFDVHAVDCHYDVEFHRRNRKKKIRLTDDELAAQGLIFFLAGYENTSSLLGFCSYILTTNKEVQEKLIIEIDDHAPTRDDVGYELLSKMPYLDQVFCETLRFYPPNIFTDRVCNETFSSGDLTIQKGTRIWINIYGLHHSPELWPEPERFIPERFTPENREKRHPFAFIPFSAGPRTCIGMRFALMGAKMALIRVLQKYRLETCPETEIPPKLGPFGLLQPPNGIKLRAVPRK